MTALGQGLEGLLAALLAVILMAEVVSWGLEVLVAAGPVPILAVSAVAPSMGAALMVVRRLAEVVPALMADLLLCRLTEVVPGLAPSTATIANQMRSRWGQRWAPAHGERN